MLSEPSGCVHEPIAEEVDVEHVRPVSFLSLGEKVEQQGAQPGPVERFGNQTIASTVTAASRAMGEDDNAARVAGDGEVSAESISPDGYLYIGIEGAGRAIS